jgi:hypothetical protein
MCFYLLVLFWITLEKRFRINWSLNKLLDSLDFMSCVLMMMIKTCNQKIYYHLMSIYIYNSIIYNATVICIPCYFSDTRNSRLGKARLRSRKNFLEMWENQWAFDYKRNTQKHKSVSLKIICIQWKKKF